MAKVKCDICNRNFKNEEALELHNQAKHGVKAPESKELKSKKTPSKLMRNIIAGVIGLIIIVIGVYLILPSNASGNYDTFAQCISDSGAKMYGAYWCPACNQQKDMFGASWQNIEYIECSLPNRGGQTSECSTAGIQSYPTWEFGDGSRSIGVISLQQLSQITGCSLVEDSE